MAAIRTNTQVELDLFGPAGGNVVNVHEPMVEIDRLGFVLEKESDVRDEERLFHELLVE